MKLLSGRNTQSAYRVSVERIGLRNLQILLLLTIYLLLQMIQGTESLLPKSTLKSHTNRDGQRLLMTESYLDSEKKTPDAGTPEANE